MKKIKLPKITEIKNNKNSRKYLPIFGVLILMITGLYLFTDELRCRDCVYSDGDIRVRSKDLNNEVTSRQKFYQYKNQTVNEEIFKNDALELLKIEQKIYAYANDKNINVSSSEVDALYQERIKQNQGEDNLLKLVRDMYGFNKDDYLNVLEKDILREKVQKDLGVPLSEWLKK